MPTEETAREKSYNFSLSGDRENRKRIWKSDFIKVEGGELFNYKNFNFHLLGNKESFHFWGGYNDSSGPLDVIAENPNSNYMLTSNEFINRYNLIDSIKLKINLEKVLGTYKSQSITYSDSLIYISVPIGEFSELLNFEFNRSINIPVTKDQDLRDHNKLYAERIKKIPSYLSDDGREEFIDYCYQMKKYNNQKINIESLDRGFFENSYSGFKNVFYDKNKYGHKEYKTTPYVVLAYNFRTSAIEFIIDRYFKAFNTISELQLDKRNGLLVIQSGEYFTIYNLAAKKELYTFKGIINYIDNNNNLVFDTYFNWDERYSTETSFYGGEFSYRISEKKIKLDELYTIDKSTPSFTLLKFDEFTSKENFDIACENNRMALNTSTFKFKPNVILPPKTFSYSYSNNDIKKKYEAKISLTKKLSQYDAPDINWFLKYDTYKLNNDGGLLTLKSDPIKFETLNILDLNGKSPYADINKRRVGSGTLARLVGEGKYSIGENSNYHETTLLLEKDPINQEYFIAKLSISRVTIDEAKLIKESQQPVSINLSRVIIPDIPNFYNIFISNYNGQIENHWASKYSNGYPQDFKSYFNNQLIGIPGFFRVFNQATLKLNGKSEIIISSKQIKWSD
jgi:hypothetical protein